MKQDVMPIYTSEFIPKVLDFYTASLAHENDRWLIKGTSSLKTVRIPKNNYIDIENSEGVVGFREYLSSKYVHFNSQKYHIIQLTSKAKNENYLVDANVALKSYNYDANKINAVFEGYVPAKIRFHVKDNCMLEAMPPAKSQDEKEGIISLSYETQKDINVTVTCR